MQRGDIALTVGNRAAGVFLIGTIDERRYVVRDVWIHGRKGRRAKRASCRGAL